MEFDLLLSGYVQNWIVKCSPQSNLKHETFVKMHRSRVEAKLGWVGNRAMLSNLWREDISQSVCVWGGE